MKLFQQILSIFRPKPDLKFVARQLRRPSGDFADKIAAKMNEGNAPLFNLTLETMQPDEEDSILEIGFGSGKFFPKIFDQAPQAKICGLDYSPEMVKMAIQNNRSAVDNHNLVLKEGNSNNIPFPSHSFDKVFCNMVIYFWDEPEEHLKEVYRVLKPFGRFYTGLRTKDSMLQLPFVEHGFNLYDKKEWCGLLRQNGFKIIRVAEKLDPEIESDSQPIQLHSVCIEAEKEFI